MKRVLLALLVVVLVGFNALAEDVYPEYTGESATITMWAWTSNEDYSIDEFQKAYPSIEVVRESFGVHYDKAQTALAAGSGLPDVLMVECTYAAQYMDLGAFQPINSWLDEETFIQLFGEPALKWCQFDGNIYGTPKDSGALALFYMVDTAFVHVPIMSNVASSISEHMQDYVDGKIERFADILSLWKRDATETMKEFGYGNVVTGALP